MRLLTMFKLPPKKTVLLHVLLIMIFGFIVYANSLNGKFLWDDEGLVQNNSYIRSWSNFTKVFTQNIMAGFGETSNHYRPIQIVTYMLDYSVWKLNVIGYHLTNILLHILAALTIYWLISILYSGEPLAFIVSLLFVIHPVHTVAVSYISGRADILVAIFMTLSLILYIKYLNLKKNYLLILFPLAYILALLSRENALILPVLLLLYHYVFRKKFNFYVFGLLLSIAFVYILVRITVLKSLLVDISGTTTFLDRLPGFFAALCQYFRLLLLPFDLHVEYGKQLFRPGDPKVVIGFFISLFLLIYAYKQRKRNPLVFFSISWFFLALLPCSNIYAINAYMAENWLYIPSIGFFLLLANSLISLDKIEWLQTKSAILAALILFGYAFLTVRQNYYWKAPIAFYERNLKYSQNSSKLLNNLGKKYYEAQDEEKAVALIKKAIEANPYNLNAYNNLAVIYIQEEKVSLLIPLLEKMVEIDPKNSKAYYNLGEAYAKIGNKEESIRAYKKVIAINPEAVEAYNNIAAVYADSGNIDEAIALWNRAVELSPDFATAHFNLAVFYFKQKKYDLAVKHCDKVTALGDKVEPEFLQLLAPYRKQPYAKEGYLN